MKLRPDQRVTLETAKERALAALESTRPQNASTIAAAIWPDHQMAAQGAGAAASRILKALEVEGKAMWSVTDNGRSWGWFRT